jgi:hypothetical protein
VSDILFHVTMGYSCVFHLDECIDEQLFSIEGVARRTVRNRNSYDIFHAKVFNELTEFALCKLCLIFRFIVVLAGVNSLRPLWMLVGYFVFFLQWDITQEFIFVPKGQIPWLV